MGDIPVSVVAIVATGMVICFVLFVVSLVRNQIDRTAVQSSLAMVKASIDSAEGGVKKAVSELGTKIELELAAHHARLVTLESTQQRWDNGHALNNDIQMLKTKQVDSETWMESIRKGIHELRGDVHAASMKTTLEIQNVRQEVAVLDTTLRVSVKMMGGIDIGRSKNGSDKQLPALEEKKVVDAKQG